MHRRLHVSTTVACFRKGGDNHFITATVRACCSRSLMHRLSPRPIANCPHPQAPSITLCYNTIILSTQRRHPTPYRMLFGCDTQLVVERVVPDLLHIVPVGYDAMLDRILERENTCSCEVNAFYVENFATSANRALTAPHHRRTSLSGPCQPLRPDGAGGQRSTEKPRAARHHPRSQPEK